MSYLRSGERASEEEVRRSKNIESTVKRGVGAAATLGAAALGGPIAARLAPFMSELIPVDLAVKGISKISPKLGSMLQAGMSAGLDIEDGIDFLRDKISGNKPAEQPKEDRNIIQQYSPELHEFIAEQVSGGRSPIEAAAVAQNDKRFAEVIKKLSKDHKTPWSNIIESVYGAEGGQSKAALQPQQAEAAQPRQPGQSQQQGMGPGQQALMEVLQKLQQLRGK